MISKNETLDKVYTAKNHAELMEAYKGWAADYDADTVGQFGYVAHVVSAEALHEALKDPSAYVLDAGCGTGLVGEELAKKGYERMDALEQDKAWELLCMQDADYLQNEKIGCKLCTYKVLS